jgi:GTPase SAR1 family protein
MTDKGGDVACDYTFKTIIIGESNVGKSSLLEVFVNGRMNEVSRHTVGVSYGARTIAVPTEDGASGSTGSDTAVVRMMCWDTVSGLSC